MQVPLEITYNGVDRSDWSEGFIREQALKLERYAPDIIACRVAVEKPHRHQNKGLAYHVRVEVTLPPRKDLVAVAEPPVVEQRVELRTVIRKAFHAMERQVKKAERVRRGDVKTHAEQPVAFITRLFPDEGYGFAKTPDGRDVYFHRNSVLRHDFDRLAVGTEVQFEEEMGEDGPQASSLYIIDKPGTRVGKGPGGGEEAPTGWKE